MKHIPTILFGGLLMVISSAHAAGLPDTGQDTCYNDTVADGVPASAPNSIARDAGTHPRQDCRYGRDAAAAAGALTKIGAGAKGFDYTKIANNGSALGAGASLGTAAGDWACTRDNTTGLTWEVKSASSASLRYSDHPYTWYNPHGAANGGNAGSEGINSCNSTLASGNCNTLAYATAVNAAQLCGQSDWRLPTRRELMTLVYANGSSPAIDPTYFPNTPSSSFWSASTFAPDPDQAWQVIFFDGFVSLGEKVSPSFSFVRLVRGSQF